MIFCILVPCHTPGIIFLNLLKMRSKNNNKKRNNLAAWGFGTDQQPQYLVLVSAGFVCSPLQMSNSSCSWGAPAKWQSPHTSKQMQGGVWRDPNDPNKLMAELELNHTASLVFQSLSFKLLGSLWVFKGYFWKVRCWHKWILEFKTKRCSFRTSSAWVTAGISGLVQWIWWKFM